MNWIAAITEAVAGVGTMACFAGGVVRVGLVLLVVAGDLWRKRLPRLTIRTDQRDLGTPQ